MHRFKCVGKGAIAHLSGCQRQNINGDAKACTDLKATRYAPSNQSDTIGCAAQLRSRPAEKHSRQRRYEEKLIFLRQIKRPRRQRLGLLVFSHVNTKPRCVNA